MYVSSNYAYVKARRSWIMIMDRTFNQGDKMNTVIVFIIIILRARAVTWHNRKRIINENLKMPCNCKVFQTLLTLYTENDFRKV